ncbi:hypothetical protein HX99_05980 [Peptococcaceae bacterium SCADC1_2_3]|jgi:hypothetical protein|nr:hypothetical protein DK28_0201530 [Peptococcaceae bacterium SCADC1_2_3]KFI35453.1 hypothetical protein HX99_05980 [Peptococcaceae bacterium SCADC1_2_3]
MKIGAGGLIAAAAQEAKLSQQIALQSEPLLKKGNEQQTSSIPGINKFPLSKRTELLKLTEELNKVAENLFGYPKFSFRVAKKEKGYGIEIIDNTFQKVAGEVSPEMLQQPGSNLVLITGLLLDRMV